MYFYGCNNDENCISDLVEPIFGKRKSDGTKAPDLNPDWLEEKISGTECSQVPDTMSHLLWGPDWVNRDMEYEGKSYAKWDPLDYESGDAIRNGDEIQLQWLDTNDRLNCSETVAREICIKQAETLCNKTFAPSIGDIGGIYKLENSPSSVLRDYGTHLIFFIMFGSIIYALYSEKIHRDRVLARQRKQQEDSISYKQSTAKIAPEGLEVSRDRRNEEKDNQFFEMLTSDSGAKRHGTIRWWDINFLEQEMEDAFRKTMHLEKLMEFRILIIVGLVVVFGYQFSIVNSRVTIKWPHRIILAVYCCLVIPLTIRENFVKYQVLSEFMFSNTMILVSVIFLMIAYLDKFEGTPTQSYLLMGLVFFFQIIIMYVTGIVWFRKILINLFVAVVYIYIAMNNRRSCIGYDQFLNGPGDGGEQISQWNAYPLLQLIPDYDTFKYNMSCGPIAERADLIKQVMFVLMLWAVTSYTGYYQEQVKRVEFGRKWGLVRNKIDTDKKLKVLMDKQSSNTKKRESLFGEIRDLSFKSPMMKITSTLDRLKLVLGEDMQIFEALNTIEETLKNNDDLNKVDIQKQDLNEKDKEFAQFVLSTGGHVKNNRDRVRSVPNLIADNDAKGAGLLQVVDLPEGATKLCKSFAPIVDYLAKYEDWGFDMLYFDRLTNGNPMYFIFMKHMDRFYENYNFDLECMKSFALYVEENYSFNPEVSNPYHTNLHGADVLQTVGCMLKTQFVNTKLTGLDKITLLIASMMHDFRHKGVNNAYLCNSSDMLALLHNDSSVLERFHASETFLLLKGAKTQGDGTDLNFLKGLSVEDYKQFRQNTIDLILATDLSQGYQYINKFNAYHKKGIIEWGNKPEDILILMQMVLKVADVSHPTKALDQHKCWSVKITSEFYQQGDQEKQHGMTVSPLCCRNKNFDIPKSQTGFIDFVVSPTIKNCAKMLELKEALHNLKTNYKYWSELHKSHTTDGTVDKSWSNLKEQVDLIQKEWVGTIEASSAD
mmetsp:Transcript_6336/g.12510  ORF Transcript_6336/g.12510 Transcript_6336/m.12510 type:complete len:994 (-) Transcript_6336:76-3057(-)|eukprot:CAMPEP_0118655526 /NCGR_PEP_ID=MMETSP0785-20121206/12977_1 /TAXON_ID=91992 /ORGANISM="Bolidomonas pacifica, Strain CCMP 1866" /LENGTH=993 /DNA_ID=CAMNT_0006548273 /DNA_START=583 /DNA_END=3564 /DNA_ORIENTATION=+